MIFDNKLSILHYAAGFIAGLLCFVFPAASVLIASGFAVYQVAEREEPLCKLGDIAEFMLGFALGLPSAALIFIYII